jgi:hypothetical protein
VSAHDYARPQETCIIEPMSAPARFESRPLPSEAGWRRAAVALLFVCLAILQGLSPLLHVHLDATVGGDPSRETAPGVHLPVSLAHSGHAVPGLHAPCAGMDDSAVITSPSELKRDERLALGATVAMQPLPGIPALAAERPDVAPTLPAPPDRTARLRPPAHAPPRIA